LVGQRTAHALEKNRVVRMLQHAAVSLLLDVLEVLAGLPLRRIVLAHVAQPAGELGELLAAGAVADPIDGKMSGRGERRTGEKGDDGFGVVTGRHDEREINGISPLETSRAASNRLRAVQKIEARPRVRAATLDRFERRARGTRQWRET